MALQKVPYVSGVTVIPAQNLNDIQDAIINLENGGFITRTVSNLTNYYLKSETYTQAEINALVSAIPKFSIQVVSSLPTSGISSTTVYLLKTGDETSNLYTEYIYVNGSWESLGSQTVDLSGYALKTDVPTKLSALTNDAGFITKTVSDLVNYYNKTETDAKFSKLSEEKLSKNQGAANVGKILVVGTDGNLVLADMPEGGASGDVIGTLDENNNILLSGNLADGTYTLKYLNADGSYTDVGSLVVGEIQPEPDTPAYTNLANPTSSDWQEGYRLSISSGSTAALSGHTVTNYIPCTTGDVLRVKGLNIIGTTDIADGAAHAKIVAYNSSKTKLGGLYSISSNDAESYDSKVTVNGDISTYTIMLKDNGEQTFSGTIAYIRIDGMLIDGYASEDVIITINEEIPLDTPDEPTNLAKPNDTYWKEGYRLSIGSGGTSACEGHTVTNFIPAKMGDILRVKGMSITTTLNSQDSKIVWYSTEDTESSKIGGMYGTTSTGGSTAYANKVTVNGDVSEYTLAYDNNGSQVMQSTANYIRIDGVLLDGYTKDDVIITINEEIA